MIDEKKRQLSDYFKKKNVIKAILFGSHARGTPSRRSDYDLIVIQKTDKRFFDRYDYFNDLYELLDDRLDLLIYTPEEWESIRDRIFFRKILDDAETIHVG